MVKKYNKLLTSLMVIFAIVFSISIAYSANNDTVSVKIDEMIEDKEGWIAQEELTFEKDSVTHTFSKNNIFSNQNYTFLNEFVSFNIDVFPLSERSYKPRYILLRAKEANTLPYRGNDSYLFVLSDTQIELQRWINNGSVYLAVVENPIESGNNLIQCGALNTSDGVQIVLYVNGELVISVLDKEPGILREQKGYLGFFNTEVTKISSVGEKDVKPLPIASDFKISGSGSPQEEIKASYNFIDVNGDKEKDTKITWYTSKEDFTGKSLSTMTAVPRDGLLTKIEGAEGRSYTPNVEDVAKYIVAAIEPSSESGAAPLYYSNAIYIDPVGIALSNNICMIDNEQMTCVFGDNRQIDLEDPYIVPEVIDGITYVPLRFVIETLGGNIEWNNELSQAEFVIEGNAVSLVLGAKNMIVNGIEKNIEAPSYILYGRIMVPVSSLKEFSGKHVYTSNNGVILIGNNENELNFDSNKELYDTIFKTIRYASYSN